MLCNLQPPAGAADKEKSPYWWRGGVVAWCGAQTTATHRQTPSDRTAPGRLAGRHRRQRHCLERQHAGQLQLHHHHVQQHGHRGAPDFNHKMRSFAVQRIALGIQLAQPPQGIGHLQQRARGVVPQAPVNIVGRCVQVQHFSARVQALAVGSPQNGPPPVDSTAGMVPAVSSSRVACSRSRKRTSPSRSKKVRIEQPIRSSITWSESRNATPSRRASCLPRVDFPEPGRPMRQIGVCILAKVGITEP